MQVNLERIRQQLHSLAPGSAVWIAYSGGLDSHVLLHCLYSLRQSGFPHNIKAVHVHHGLHVDADEWTRHCQRICKHLDIHCEVLQVDARAGNGESPEAAARQARYQGMAALLEEGDFLLTAHHQDDQAETVLLQLMRGSGVAGLAAMPRRTSFSRGFHLRPLLDYRREDLYQYALAQRLEWIEDSSNESRDFDRNYLRHEILPLLEQRWPAASANLSRTADHMAEASEILEQRAGSDLQQMITEQQSVHIPSLVLLSESRQKNVLRYWIKRQGYPLPATRHLQHILEDVIYAREDAEPCVRWEDVEMRRYRDQLYALKQQQNVKSSKKHFVWDLKHSLEIPGLGVLMVKPVQGRGLKASLADQSGISIAFRSGGERLRPAGRQHEHELKKIFQERGIPPWERDRIPILYIDETIAAVVGICLCNCFLAGPDEPGLELIWQSA